MEPDLYKLEIFIPEESLPDVRRALQEADAGHIGNYDSCLSYSSVTGSWRPLEGTHPYIGSENEVSEEPEIKVEVTIRREQLADTVSRVKKVHPYEEPVINIIPMYSMKVMGV